MTLKLNGTTSGSVSLDAPATGSDISLTLPGSVGTSGQLLSTDGAGVLSFVNGGKILQVVRATDTTNRSTTSTSAVDITGMSVTITPQKSNSAILIIVNMRAGHTASPAGSVRFVVTDSSNNAISGAQEQLQSGFSGGIPVTLIAYATPATTSAVTYKVRWYVDAVTSTAFANNGIATGQLYAIEVAA